MVRLCSDCAWFPADAGASPGKCDASRQFHGSQIERLEPLGRRTYGVVPSHQVFVNPNSAHNHTNTQTRTHTHRDTPRHSAEPKVKSRPDILVSIQRNSREAYSTVMKFTEKSGSTAAMAGRRTPPPSPVVAGKRSPLSPALAGKRSPRLSPRRASPSRR